MVPRPSCDPPLPTPQLARNESIASRINQTIPESKSSLSVWLALSSPLSLDKGFYDAHEARLSADWLSLE